MISRIAGLLLVVMAGYLFRTADRRIERLPMAVAIAIALVGSLAMLSVTPNEPVERAAGGESWSGVAAVVGIFETSVVWLPTLLVPWSSRRTRFAACALILGSALQTAVAFCRPFDVVYVNRERILASPSYLFGAVVSLPIALVGYGIGSLRSRRRQVA